MRYRDATLTLSPSCKPEGLVVDGMMTLRELVETRDLEQSRYLLVTVDDGHVAGIVSVTEVIQCVTCENSVERNRWLEKTVESLIPWAFHGQTPQPPLRMVRQGDESDDEELPMSAVMRDGVVSLIADRDDVFLRWSQIENILHNIGTDPLTGLCTRSVFERLLNQELARSQRQECPMAVMLFDLDRLKQINDQHGHAQGDFALKALATAITENLRSYDVVARYAGDEFASICFDCGPNQIDRPVQRILNAVNDVTLENGESVSVSIGVAIASSLPEPDSMTELLNLADDCLYRAKNSGRNRAYVGFADHGRIEELVVGSEMTPTLALD